MDDVDSVETREINLRDYWAILVKRRWLGISFFLIVVVLTALYSLSQTKIYSATAQVMLEKSNPNVLTPQEFFSGEMLTPEFLQTQYRIIESRSLARNVVRKMNLTSHPEFVTAEDMQTRQHPISNGNVAAGAAQGPSPLEERVISEVMGRITVSPIRNSLLINIGFEARDPQAAARVANAVAAAYIDWSLALRLKTQQNSANFLDEQVREQKTKLEASEQALQQYREKYGVVALNSQTSPKEGNVSSQKLVQITSQLVDAQNKRIEAETRYKKAIELVKNPDQAESIPEVVTNQLVNQIKNQEVDLLRKKADLAEKFGQKHPAMVALNQEIENLKKKKTLEIQNVVSSLKSQYDIAVSQEQSLRAAASRSRNETLEQNKVSIDFQMLQQEVDSNRTLYDMLLKRLKEANVSEENRYINIHIVDPAEVPKTPSRPTPRRNIMLAMVIGLMGGLGLIFFFEYLDNTIKTPDDVQYRFGLPYLGPVPNFEIKENDYTGELVLLNAPKASASEAFRGLRTSLFFSFSQQGPKVILITSADAREGKTLVASNLAVAMAQGGNRVLILDCDMRRPRVHKLFNLKREPGMSNVLAGAESWEQLVKPTGVDNLWVIPAGPIPPNPAELITSDVMPRLIQELHGHYDRIIIDSPPIIAVTDSVALSRMADGVVLVVKVGTTPRNVIESALRQLKDIDAKVLGLVLNDIPVNKDNYYYSHYYYYNYHYGEEVPFRTRGHEFKNRLQKLKRVKKAKRPDMEA
jgi:polysaccharide biosynthesis transport protein